VKNTALLILLVTLLSCGNSDQGSTGEIDDDKSEETELGTRKLNKDELAAFMPDSIQGYIPKKEPEGLDMPFSNASFSFTTQYYYNENDSVNIELFDYLECPSEYERYADLWWEGGTHIEEEEFSSKYLPIDPEVHGWEVFDKSEQRTTVYVGAFDRFYLIFECFGKENATFIVQIAKDFDYEKLRTK
jgi:hypothetical protein